MTREQIKKEAKRLKKNTQKKKLGECLEFVSKINGYKDWNTASATAPKGK